MNHTLFLLSSVTGMALVYFGLDYAFSGKEVAVNGIILFILALYSARALQVYSLTE